MPARFQVSTNRTGIHRVIKVALYDTTEELQAAYYRQFPKASPEYPPIACFHSRPHWGNQDPHTVQGWLRFARDSATATLVAHESVHAATQLYFIDRIKSEHQRAVAHMNAGNETIAYLVGDLFGKIALQLMRRGVSLDVGNPRHYGDEDHAP